MEPLIKVQCLKHIYPDKTEVNLCGLDFIVKPGERVVVLGPNGSGKTTLISHILGLLSPVEGTVEVLGLSPDKNFNKIRKEIGVVFQNVDEQIIGPRVYDDIAFTPRNEGLKKDEVERIVSSAANMLNIEHLLNKIPHYLSGGQKKKVALAGALATMPQILIMDEPFDALDPKSKKEMVNLLNKLNKEKNITLILTTHDIDVVPQLADTIYVINHGNIVMKGTPEEVFSNVDVLRCANLEPPILAELFSRLCNNGFKTNIPKEIDEAEKLLMMLLEKRQIV
ncbi:energy-coupling factor ABC transporter ATP-binding protein [Serpentinicella alkaliphila]|uniref:Cobalt/nickel transport system ATP-binding protein n=1 Tax=Serpentinicella alkaliphila TaxID=1734049 RepID=A0A4R2TIX6_9FIRM|nr:ATP-binding cassette domain-containing protein [Serpentinicella alkaliphila]QUH24811.1 ATP-binding cassette domain-containing protein [Serpentinicella alkaliphila]TCQ03488.1 cobalt/nickel transport system ATP-binding protein [Serpentinicella alkaliphila]